MSVIVIDTISGRIKKIQAELGNVEKEIVKSLAQVSSDITKRTQSGIDYKGTPFAPYSNLYKQMKGDSGRQNSPVNLTYHSHMLNGKVVKKISGGGKIWFPDKKQRDKASWHHNGTSPYTIRVKNKRVLANKAAGIFFGKEVRNPGLKKRQFFELSQSNIDYIESYLLRKIKKAVRG